MYKIQVGGPTRLDYDNCSILVGTNWQTKELACSARQALDRLKAIAAELGEGPFSLRVLNPEGREIWAPDRPPLTPADVDPNLIPF